MLEYRLAALMFFIGFCMLLIILGIIIQQLKKNYDDKLNLAKLTDRIHVLEYQVKLSEEKIIKAFLDNRFIYMPLDKE